MSLSEGLGSRVPLEGSRVPNRGSRVPLEGPRGSNPGSPLLSSNPLYFELSSHDMASNGGKYCLFLVK